MFVFGKDIDFEAEYTNDSGKIIHINQTKGFGIHLGKYKGMMSFSSNESQKVYITTLIPSFQFTDGNQSNKCNSYVSTIPSKSYTLHTEKKTDNNMKYYSIDYYTFINPNNLSITVKTDEETSAVLNVDKEDIRIPEPTTKTCIGQTIIAQCIPSLEGMDEPDNIKAKLDVKINMPKQDPRIPEMNFLISKDVGVLSEIPAHGLSKGAIIAISIFSSIGFIIILSIIIFIIWKKRKNIEDRSSYQQI